MHVPALTAALEDACSVSSQLSLLVATDGRLIASHASVISPPDFYDGDSDGERSIPATPSELVHSLAATAARSYREYTDAANGGGVGEASSSGGSLGALRRLSFTLGSNRVAVFVVSEHFLCVMLANESVGPAALVLTEAHRSALERLLL